MSDLVEKGGPRPDFAETMRAAEESAGIPSDVELYGEQFDNPQPDEFGRVSMKRSDSQPESEVQDAVEAEPESETIPEPEKEAEEDEEERKPLSQPVEDPFAELNKKVGQLVNDNADLRRQLEEYQNQPGPQVDMPQLEAFDEWAQENPVQAAEWAAQNKQPHLYDRAIRTWHEQDPVGAGRFERQLEQTLLLQNITQQFQPQLQSAEKMAAEADIERAIQAVASKHPDFGEVVGILDEAAVQKIMESGLPAGVLANALQGSAAEKEQAIETVYRWQKAEMAGTLDRAAKASEQQSKDEAREEKLAAYVGSATTTVPDAVPESEAERQARAWEELSPSLSKAWLGRDSRPRLGR